MVSVLASICAAVSATCVLGVAAVAAAQEVTPPANPVADVAPKAAGSAAADDSRWEIEARGGVDLFDFRGGVGDYRSLVFNGPDVPLLGTANLGANVSSWFFGLGNQNLGAAIGAAAGVTGLFRTLLQPDTYRRDPSFGVGVSRRLTRRLAAEFSLDAGATGLALGGQTAKSVAATVASYPSAFNALFRSAPTVFTGTSVTASSTYQSGGHPVLATVALAVRLAPRGRVHPFLTFGAGATSASGPIPQVTLVGHYAFVFTAGGPNTLVSAPSFPVPIDQTDRVTVQYGSSSVHPVGVAGVGFTFTLSPRSSFRLEGRAIVGRDDPVTLSATPSQVVGQPTGVLDYPYPTPFQLQFSTDPRFPSTLSFPVSGLRTFNGGGGQVRLAVTAGYVLRLGLLPHDAVSPHVPGPPHRFFDKLNSSFIAMELGAALADAATTQYVFHHVPGSFEGDPLERWFEDRGWPGASLGTAVAVAEDIGLCWLLHHTGHHEVERLVPLLAAGGSATAATANLALVHDSRVLGLGR